MKLALTFIPFAVMAVLVGCIGTEMGVPAARAQLIGTVTIVLWIMAGKCADWIREQRP